MQSAYKLKGDTSDFDRKIRKSKQNLTQFASQGKLGMEGMTKAIGSSIARFASWTAVIAGAGKLIGDVVKKNKEFEQANANLAAVLGTTRDNISLLTEDAKKLGAATMYTASQVTDLQTELAKLGFNQGEIKNATKDVLNFAAATGADLGGAAALCGAALRSWGLDSKEMGRVASSMAVATSKSALSYEKLASSLSTVAPVAAKFGFSIEDTLALLGKLSDAGFDASSAATATRNIFLNMADSSGKLAQALGRPIKSLDDLAPALAELNAKGIDLAEMLNLTDKRSVAAFATLVSGSNKLQDLRDSITGCNDALQSMVNEQMNTLEGSTKIMQSAWEGLMLTFSNSNGILKGVTDSLGKFLSQWAQWRALNNGGEGAIASMEKGLSPQQQKEIEASLKYRQEMGLGGKDLEIAKATKEKYEKERDEIKKTYDLWLKRHEMIKKESGAVNNAEFAPIKGMSNTMDVNEDFAKKIAAKNDLIAQEQFKIDYLSPKAATQAADETAKAVETAEQKLSTRILAIKNQEAKDIAAIDREKFKTEEQYENEVYRIKRESLLKQRSLYAEGGDKYIQTDTAIANLDIQHQARLNRGFGKSQTVSVEEFVVPGSLKDLKNILAEAQECLEGCVVGSEAWAEALEEVKKAQEDVNAAQELITPKTKAAADNAQATTDAWQNATMALQSAGSAMNSIENPAAKVAGTVAQAVASVMLGFAQASIQGAALGPWGWIATTMSALATAVATVSTIKSVTAGSYAEGGIVPGSSYSGDKLTANVNSGELILNRAQQSSIAGQLQQKGMAGGVLVQGETTVTGEQIKIAYNNYAKRRGVSGGAHMFAHTLL